MSKIYRQYAITLIELLMVIFIVGILAAIALPAYFGYQTRAMVSEGMVLATQVRTDAELYWNLQGQLATSNAEAGSAAPERLSGQYVVRTDVQANGEIVVTYGTELKNAQLVLTPREINGRLRWRCSSPSIPATMLPKECKP